MGFNVGDEVKVRSNLYVGMNSKWGVVSDMIKLAGKTCHIGKIYDNDEYRLLEDEGNYNWSEEMFEPIEKTLHPSQIVNLQVKAVISNYDEVTAQIEKLEEMLKNLKVELSWDGKIVK